MCEHTYIADTKCRYTHIWMHSYMDALIYGCQIQSVNTFIYTCDIHTLQIQSADTLICTCRTRTAAHTATHNDTHTVTHTCRYKVRIHSYMDVRYKV